MPPKPDNAIPPDALEHAKSWCAHYISKNGFGLMNVISGDPVPWDVGINVATRDAESLQRQREAEREKERKSPGIPESADKAEFAPRPRDALIEKILPGTIKRLAIVGEGGSGKSEYTRRIAFRLAEHFLKGDNSHTALLPVHVELKKLEERQFPNGLDADSLRHALVRESVWNSWLGHFAAAHRVVFILDGMDEVRTGNHDTFAVSLSELISGDFPGCVFILAGRPGSIPANRLGEFAGSAEHRIEPLTDVQIQQYAGDYFKIPSTEHPFGADIAARFVTELRSHQSTLYPLIRRPFMLAFAAAEFSRPPHSIPSNPAELVERGLTRLFIWQQSRHDRSMASTRFPDGVGAVQCLDILGTLAAFALVNASDESKRNRIAFGLEEGRDWLLENAGKLEALAGRLGTDQIAERLIRQLAPASGVLYMSGNTVGFTNKVIAEFLAARWIARYGYPNWPYRDKPNEYVRSQDVRDDRERSLFDFFGDYAWTNDGDGLAQAVRFQLGKPPTKPAPEEEQRRHVANLSVLLRSADWYCQTAQPLLAREGHGLDARGTLAGRVSRFLQALPESLAPAEQGRAISMAHAVVPIEGDWFESDFWPGWIARLPNHCRLGYFEPLRLALTKAMENPAENGSAIRSLATAMATAFPGAGPLANEVLAALREALAKAMENPAGNGYAIDSLATAMATAFPGAGPLANEVLAALREALTKAMENPAENGSAIRSLATAMATAFPGAGPLANEVLAALREALTKARENPAENGSAIRSLATAMATAFPGAGPLANEVLAALREALTKARENPAENGYAIGSLARAMATAFPGAGPLANEVLAPLREALTKAMENPAENGYEIGYLATAMATAFPGAGPLANEVLAALREALTKAMENPAENWYAIYSLATAMATAFPGAGPLANEVLAALREALTKARENPAENWSAIGYLATAMATAFPGAGPLANEVLAPLREALAKAMENPAENGYAIDSLATAMATAFPGAGPLANEVLAALREALTKAMENPAENGSAIGSLARAMATAFPGRLDAAKVVIEAERAGVLDIESWNDSVTLFGDEGLLQKYFIDSWCLRDDSPIIARLDRPIDPDDPKPQAVIVAPRENIRRGLPAWVLGKIIAGETERPFKVEECLPAVAKALNFELRKDAINIRDALSIIDDIKRHAFEGGHVPGNVDDETLVARLAGKFRELPETLRRFQELVMEPRLRIRFVDEKWAAYLDASDGTASDSLVELTNNEFVFFKALAAAEPRTGVYPADITEKFECGRLTPADIVNGLLRQKKRRNVMSIISLVVRPGRDAVGFRLAKTAWFPPHGDAPPPQK